MCRRRAGRLFSVQIRGAGPYWAVTGAEFAGLLCHEICLMELGISKRRGPEASSNPLSVGKSILMDHCCTIGVSKSPSKASNSGKDSPNKLQFRIPIQADRLEKARTRDPKTLTYDPSSLRRYNRNSDYRIVIVDDKTARHTSTWMVVMKTNVNIHISAIGRYKDKIEKRDGKWLIVRRIRTE